MSNEDMPDDELHQLIEEMRVKILEGALDEPESKDHRLYAMLNTGLMIARELEQYECMIVLATKHENFITGDTPIITGTEKNGEIQLGTSFSTPDNAVYFPIASKVCLLWKRGIDPGYGRLPPRGVRMVNRHVMRFARRFIYARSYSVRLAERFSRIRQEIILGQTAFVPMWEGKVINLSEESCVV